MRGPCRRRAVPALPLLGMVGCAGATVATRVTYDHADVVDVFRYAAGGGDVLVKIRGNPTRDSKGAFDGAVLSAMRGRHGGPPTGFATTTATTRAVYRIVLVFGAPGSLGETSACGGGAAPPAGAGGRINVRAAFCYKDQPLSSARVSFGPVSGASDPRLADAMGQATLSLVPISDPDRRERNEPIRLLR